MLAAVRSRLVTSASVSNDPNKELAFVFPVLKEYNYCPYIP